MPANIDYAKCDNCGACYINCPLDVFERDDDLGIYSTVHRRPLS